YECIFIRENVWEVHLRCTPFDLYRGALEPSQAADLQEALTALHHDLDLAATCVLLQFPFWRQAGLGLRQTLGARIVYDCIADWFDLDLMVEVAKSRPKYSFVLIGQVHLSDVSALSSLPNAHLLGEQAYQKLPGYLRQFDVCALPFRMNQLTRAVDPVKLYE